MFSEKPLRNFLHLSFLAFLTVSFYFHISCLSAMHFSRPVFYMSPIFSVNSSDIKFLRSYDRCDSESWSIFKPFVSLFQTTLIPHIERNDQSILTKLKYIPCGSVSYLQRMLIFVAEPFVTTINSLRTLSFKLYLQKFSSDILALKQELRLKSLFVIRISGIHLKRTANPQASSFPQLQVIFSAEVVHFGQFYWKFSTFIWSLILQTIFSDRFVKIIVLHS